MNPSCSALNQSCDTGQEIRRVANKLHPPNSAAPVKDPVIFWGCGFFLNVLSGTDCCPCKIEEFQKGMALLCQMQQQTGQIEVMRPRTVMGMGRPVYTIHQLYLFTTLCSGVTVTGIFLS